MDARSLAPRASLPVAPTPELAELLLSIRRDAARRTAEALAWPVRGVPRGGHNRPAPPGEPLGHAA